ncbi:MAG: ParB N-terminal domain-containing protein [Planctomycetia bacterium]|nr:ParB N-terminal domain-containing protein [Planctomycetia bacterium]
MKIVDRKISEIKPYEQNPRINDAAVDAVAASIKAFGFRKPIVVDADGVIICGHTCFRAAIKLGMTKVPTHVAADLSEAQVKALRLVDNRTAELAEWDWQKLALEVADLGEEEFELADFGFSEEFLTAMLDVGPLDGLTDPDHVPPLPSKAKTKRGDLYVLGYHRLLCGDSSSRADVDRLLGGKKAQLAHMDPPYNVAVQPRSDRVKNGGGLEQRAKDRPLTNDSMSAEDFDAVLLKWFGNMAYALEPGSAFYLWGGYVNLENYPRALRSVGVHLAQVIVWIKEHPALSRKDFNGNFELCSYGWTGKNHRFFGAMTSTDTWELSRVAEGSCQIGKGVRLEAADGARVDVLPPSEDRRLRVVKLESDDGVAVNVFNSPLDVWRVKKVPGQKMVHLTEKPVELATRAMQYSSKPGENVLDLFGGSGSTLIGAEQLGRHAFLMEFDPLYCDVIVRRWEEFTGKKATREPAADEPKKPTAKTKPKPKNSKRAA